MELSKLKKHERVSLSLRALYENYGYRRYRMGNFEEYSFYLSNKSFLRSEKIIAFNDLDGRLMALKPDVTLSIVKNAKSGDRFYYIENVYRPSAQSLSFKEIEQVGLEVIGDIDLFTECEVALLAAKSLAEIDSEYALDISHMGIINALCARLAERGSKEALLKCLEGKNAHEAKEIFGGDAMLEAIFDGDLDALDALNIKELLPFTAEIRKITAYLAANGATVNVDFSLINDAGYYNGIIFRGYAEKVPRAVLSGGRYDKLLQKLDKSCSGLGFAVYLDELDCYDVKPRFDCDVLLIYGDADEDVVTGAADALRGEGKSVRAERTVPPDVRTGSTVFLKTAEVNDA